MFLGFFRVFIEKSLYGVQRKDVWRAPTDEDRSASGAWAIRAANAGSVCRTAGGRRWFYIQGFLCKAEAASEPKFRPTLSSVR